MTYKEESDSGPFYLLGKQACASTRGFESSWVHFLGELGELAERLKAPVSKTGGSNPS